VEAAEDGVVTMVTVEIAVTTVAAVVIAVTTVEVDPTPIHAEVAIVEVVVDQDITMEDLDTTMEVQGITMETQGITLEVHPTITLAEEATVEEIVVTVLAVQEGKVTLVEEAAVATQAEVTVETVDTIVVAAETMDTIVVAVEALSILFPRF